MKSGAPADFLLMEGSADGAVSLADSHRLTPRKLDDTRMNNKRISTRVALIYFLVGALWIVFSDYVLYLMVGNSAILPITQTIKGWVFMLVTATMLYFLVAQSTNTIEKSYRQIKSMMEGTVDVLASVAEKRDPSMAGHQKRVAFLATTLAREMSLSPDRQEAVRIAATLHDLGKISIPSELLSRPGPLTTDEYRLIKIYPEISFDIIKSINFPWPVATIVLQHQERYDGSGYPAGLKGDDIMLEARILRVADFFEARTAHRPYRPITSAENALDEMRAMSGTVFDPQVVAACLALFQEKGLALPEPVFS